MLLRLLKISYLSLAVLLLTDSYSCTHRIYNQGTPKATNCDIFTTMVRDHWRLSADNTHEIDPELFNALNLTDSLHRFDKCLYSLDRNGVESLFGKQDQPIYGCLYPLSGRYKRYILNFSFDKNGTVKEFGFGVRID